MKDLVQKWWFWVIILLVIYIIYRNIQGYWTLNYIPLVGYKPRMANPEVNI